VEVAAFRIAQLALENVIRHAPAASVRLVLGADPGRVRLVITDDGPGLPPEADRVAAASGRRGLADMRAEAGGCGGSVVVEAAGPGGGTVVHFDWPAA
jgi:signal transduction histidine kinase